jgi:hypothetical protein
VVIFRSNFNTHIYNNNKKKSKIIDPSRKLPKVIWFNHLDGDPVVRAWDQEVCFLCSLRFEPCSCSYDSHWRLTWSLTSGPVGLVEVHASWPGHPCWTKNKNALIFFIHGREKKKKKIICSIPWTIEHNLDSKVWLNEYHSITELKIWTTLLARVTW